MENKFQECLERKRIIPFSRGPKLIAKELKLAGFDLSRAKVSFRGKPYKKQRLYGKKLIIMVNLAKKMPAI